MNNTLQNDDTIYDDSIQLAPKHTRQAQETLDDEDVRHNSSNQRTTEKRLRAVDSLVVAGQHRQTRLHSTGAERRLPRLGPL